MQRFSSPALTRRALLASSAASAAALTLPFVSRSPANAAVIREVNLKAAPANLPIAGASREPLAAWCYNETAPGPEIRIRQGERLKVTVENALTEETTVHWHGVRLPNAMDGVPHLTQEPIGNGESFVYEFEAVDAGTFWYHPHQRSFEQIERGLYGPLIVEEHEPVRVDRDVVWVLDDWRLARSGGLSEDFGHPHDVTHNGRIGNLVTVNGRTDGSFAVRKGERIRLRLINAANARIFGLDFAGHEPVVIALDGQPVSPHAPRDGIVVLGPAMRADLILDMAGRPGSRSQITDRFYQGLEYRLLDLAYEDDALRDAVPEWPVSLPANPVPEPDISTASRSEITFTGGMMGAMVAEEMGMTMGGGMMQGTGRVMGMMNPGAAWFVNGVAAAEDGHAMEPIMRLRRGESHIVTMTNATAWHHPMHLHGHSFRVISRDGKPSRHREWRDTVLVEPREKVEIAFVADNPGDWMLHCHVLEHQAGGMMSVIRVA